MRREYRERFSCHRLQRKPLVIDPGMHHGTCVTHVPWCMSGSLTHGGGENVPGIPGACATRKFTYLARGPWWIHSCLLAVADRVFWQGNKVIVETRPTFRHWCSRSWWLQRTSAIRYLHGPRFMQYKDRCFNIKIRRSCGPLILTMRIHILVQINFHIDMGPYC